VTYEIVQNYKRFNNKTVLPNLQGHSDHQNQINIKLHGYRKTQAKTKAYLHGSKVTESAECPCDGENQTLGHQLHECTKLR